MYCSGLSALKSSRLTSGEKAASFPRNAGFPCKGFEALVITGLWLVTEAVQRGYVTLQIGRL